MLWGSYLWLFLVASALTAGANPSFIEEQRIRSEKQAIVKNESDVLDKNETIKENIEPQKTDTNKENQINKEPTVSLTPKESEPKQVNNPVLNSKESISQTPTTVAIEAPKIEQPTPKESEPKNELYTVTKVVDGDTIDVENIGRLRLIGLNTPETVDPRKAVECFGVEASNRAKKLLLGQKVYLEYDESQGKIDRYGRTLAYVFTEGGASYNLDTIKEGYAYEYTYNKPYKYQSEYKQAQNTAQTNKLGLWSDSACKGVTESIATQPTNNNSAPKEIPQTVSNGVVKKSTNDICHDTTSKSYTRTKNFTAYNTLQECLDSGGRLPLNWLILSIFQVLRKP